MAETNATVRQAVAADAKPIAAMLARAFHDDPVFSWLMPDERRRAKRLPQLFEMFFHADGPSGLRLTTDGAEAATLWRAPGHARSGRRETLGAAWPLVRVFGWHLPRAFTVSEAIEAHFPAQPFWYLHIAGCDPAHQGRGLGGAAVRAGLERAAGRLPAYLETAKERNLPFYQRLGFRVTAEWAVPGGGPKFWSMLREADAP